MDSVGVFDIWPRGMKQTMHHHKADEASHVCVCVAIDISTILSVERFCFLRKKIPPFADEIETKRSVRFSASATRASGFWNFEKFKFHAKKKKVHSRPVPEDDQLRVN